jgi:hypothetical protein
LRGDVYAMPWYVETEKGTQQGRVDIVIACPQFGFLVAIENKVFALEQGRQIKRYHLWLESQAHAYAHRSLVFLTPDGRKPMTAGGADCICLSYKDDLSKVLRGAMENIVAPPLLTIIRQYLDVVEHFISESELTLEP